VSDSHPEAIEIEADGHMSGTWITVVLRTPAARVTLEWDASDEGADIDTLLAATPDAAEQVLEAIEQAREEEAEAASARIDRSNAGL
jgi:hypothetical protein